MCHIADALGPSRPNSRTSARRWHPSGFFDRLVRQQRLACPGGGSQSVLTSCLDTHWLDKHTCHLMRNDVRSLREGKSLSQGDLAVELGVSRQTINSIEVGRYVPSLPLALKLARFFGRSVKEMFHDD